MNEKTAIVVGLGPHLLPRSAMSNPSKAWPDPTHFPLLRFGGPSSRQGDRSCTRHECMRSSSSSSFLGLCSNFKVSAYASDLNPTASTARSNSQIMEDMDLDQVVYVPDTPDRLDARHLMGRESAGKVHNSPLACDLSNPDRVDTRYVNQPRARGRLFSENGNVRRLVIRPPRNICNLDIKSRGNSDGDNSSASLNAQDFRRAAVGKSLEDKHSTGTENIFKGKAMSIKSSSKSSAYHEKPEAFYLTKQNGHGQSPRKVFRKGELEDLDAEGVRKEQMMSVGSSFERSRNAVKGKEKMDHTTCEGLGLAVDLGKGVHLSPNPEHVMVQQKPMSHHSFVLPRAGGQKRLVRNGCISPHNIATRNKKLAEQQNDALKGTEQSHAGKVDSSGSPYVIDICDIVNEDKNSQILKGEGKGLLIHSFPPEENNARTVHASSRSLVNDNKEANRTSDLGSNTSGRAEGLGGWRSTRNRSGPVDYIFPDSTDYLPSRLNGVGNFVSQHHNSVDRRDTRSQENQMTGDDFSENLNATQTASGLVCELDRIAGPSQAAKTVIKRQKKRGLSLRNNAECSTSVPDDSDIVFLGSSGASESSRSSRSRRPQFQGPSSQVIEVDELSPAAGHSVPQGIDVMHDDLAAKARQLEADEMLARELQEQLYHEVPITEGGEIDEHLAWALHQEENASNTSIGSHNTIHLRGSTILHSNRQPRPESFQNNANRRATQARVPTSSRVAQLRTRFRNQSGRVPTRARNLRFPSDMDLDMRMNILEALEAAFDVGADNHMLQIQRDFNDNDYEMLLALDENNHQHAGATGQQINNLPQSTVQMASEEACAICLETPNIGETVRHLPCLHKFHKDCIDPWLSRRTSCPVCKCSIT